MKPTRWIRPLPLLSLCLFEPVAKAETWADLPEGSTLLATTPLQIHVQDDRELTDCGGPCLSLVWYGVPADLYNPDGVLVYSYAGDGTDPAQILDSAGDWPLIIGEDAPYWSAQLMDARGFEREGRLWASPWRLRFSSPSPEFHLYSHHLGINASTGLVDWETVQGVTFAGLVGAAVEIRAERIGIPGWEGRSGDAVDFEATETDPSEIVDPLPLFLQFTYDHAGAAPAVSGATARYNGPTCDAIYPGYSGGRVYVDSLYPGTAYHLVCDINGDGEFDPRGDPDMDRWSWDGDENDGSLSVDGSFRDAAGNWGSLSPGTYACIVSAKLAPLHLLVHNADQASPGIQVRVTHNTSPGTWVPQRMFWQDGAIQDNELVDLEVGGRSLSQPNTMDGMLSAAPGESAAPNTNSRAWGNVDSTPHSKGSTAAVNTWTAEYYEQIIDFTIDVADHTLDGDADGLPDGAESCVAGTDPTLADTDGDGLSDGEEMGSSVWAPTDTDEDRQIDALDADDDGDGIPTRTERADEAALGEPDPDGDGIPADRDLDSDGDGIPDEQEPEDADRDGTPDYLQVPATPTTDSGSTDAEDGGDLKPGAGSFGGAGCGSGTAVVILLLPLRARRRRSERPC